MKRIVICWPTINAYMAACWKALHAREGFEVAVVAHDPAHTAAVSFSHSLLKGLDHHFLTAEERQSAGRVLEIIAGFRPDVVYVPGWAYPPYDQIAYDRRFQSTPLVLGMDTPWLGTLRQRLAKYRLRRYFSRMSAFAVISERAFQAARNMGAPEEKIYRHCYAGIDYKKHAPAYELRAKRPDGWPRRFVFLGRYAEEKALDVLIDAHAVYRELHRDAWPVTCCGKGPLESLLNHAAGIENRGFVQPDELPNVLSEQGVFVNVARYDPWPLVIVEACASGLPVIASEACGSVVELVRPCYNGLTVATGNAAALANAMSWMHQHHDRLPLMGLRSQALAEPFDADHWAERWVKMIGEITR